MSSASCGRFSLNSSRELVEAVLLLEDVGSRRTGSLGLQRSMHPFVLAVLLRMSGLDALVPDAEAQPPRRQLGQPC
jgi:hypothetical protein